MQNLKFCILFLYNMHMHKKLHIKHLLIFKRAAKRKNVIDIAILLDSNQYVEYSMSFKQYALTYWVARRITSLFSNYIIDKHTNVAVNDLIDVKHPVHVFISLLHANIDFNFKTITLDKIIGRIHYYFKQKSSSKRKFNVVWKMILEKQVCPWITKQVDYALQNKSPKIEHIMKTMRLGMFYMVVKKYLYGKNVKSGLKKQHESRSSNVE